MIVIDEYLAVRVLLGHWPDQLPTDELGLPMTRHWRLLQAVHAPWGGPAVPGPRAAARA